jgi:tetratricopeptide (TPR) repeat protein
VTPAAPLRDSYESLQRQAEGALGRGDVNEAVELYRRLSSRLARLSDVVLRRRPELRDLHREARVRLAGILRQEARYAEALEVTEVLLETHPEDLSLWERECAVLQVAKGDVEAGIARLEELAQAEADDPNGWVLYGRETRLVGRLTDSEAALDRALTVADGTEPEALSRIHYERFLLLREMARLDDALGEWDRATQLASDLWATVDQVYSALLSSGRYSDAAALATRDPNPMRAGFQRGLIDHMTGRQEQALESWQTVAALDPTTFEDGHDAWVEAVLRLGDPEPALIALQGLLSTHATPRLLILSGIGWAMRQDQELAAKLFQQAISVLRRQRPPKQKLDSADWRLLDSLVPNAQLKATLRTYFAVLDTLWDSPAQGPLQPLSPGAVPPGSGTNPFEV